MSSQGYCLCCKKYVDINDPKINVMKFTSKPKSGNGVPMERWRVLGKCSVCGKTVSQMIKKTSSEPVVEPTSGV